MDFATYKSEMEVALGGSLIDVELVDADYQYAFDKAKRTFIQLGNNNLDRKFYPLSVTEGTSSYNLPSIENIDTVVRIIKPRGGLIANEPFSIATIQSLFGSFYASNQSNLFSYEMLTQYLDNIRIYTADDIQFIYKKIKNFELTLLDPPKSDETWLIEVYADLSDDEYRDNLWVHEYSLAELKIILGRAYRKFQALSTPTGETSLDGDQLVQEGKEEKIELRERIGNYVDGAPAGGVIMIG